MEWSTILAFSAGAITPMIVNWLNAKLKYHYDNKSKQSDIFKKEIRTFYIANPILNAVYHVIHDMNSNEIYIEHSYLSETVEKLQKIPLEEIPLPIFEQYYKSLGTLQYLAINGSDINNEKRHKYAREALREIHIETEKEIVKLIASYEEYIQRVKKQII
ncbi:hypothetical protein BTR23_18665 [Alkalihalophilus pseudofirmus]|nr:hypothetical protein BTR23_18665 [Alkalihalophilus pseudofirmus]